MIYKGSRVIISEPRSFGGLSEYPSAWLNRLGTVSAGGRRFVALVLDGEREQLGFFADELTVIEDAARVEP
jgi:hypothetical protein